MSESNKNVVRRWFREVWNEAKDDTIHELFPSHGIAHGLGDTDTDVRGPAEFCSFAADLRSCLRHLQVHIEGEPVAEGDLVTVRITLTGKYSGQGLGGSAPAGTDVTAKGIIILRVADGKIVEAWNSWDQLGLLRQIGALGMSGGRRDAFLSAAEG